jgi:hypothetical protein
MVVRQAEPQARLQTGCGYITAAIKKWYEHDLS